MARLIRKEKFHYSFTLNSSLCTVQYLISTPSLQRAGATPHVWLYPQGPTQCPVDSRYSKVEYIEQNPPISRQETS